MGKLGKKIESSEVGVWGRGARRVALVSALALIAATMIASPSQATIGGFESGDGDLDHDSVIDWNDFDEWYNKIVPHNASLNDDDDDVPVTGFDQLTWIQDRSGNPDDIFGGGVKQDDDCPKTKDGSLGGGGNKFDIDRMYLTHGVDTSGDDFLFMAWIRVPQNSQTASSHIAYEFNTGSEACDGLVEREPGDKLIVFDFEGGTATSTSPSLKLLEWTETSGDACEVSSNSAPCWKFKSDLDATGSEGAVNTSEIGPVTDALPHPDDELGIVEFGEAGIDLAGAGIDVCDFAGHVTGVSRSSGSSGTAQMKDKVGPAEFDLPACVQDTTVTTRVSLDDHATIGGFDADFTGDHTGTLTFSLYGPEGETDECEEANLVYETTIDPIDDGGPWSTADGDNTDDSYIVPRNAEGVYKWVVDYSGDSANNASSSICGEEVVTVEYN